MHPPRHARFGPTAAFPVALIAALIGLPGSAVARETHRAGATQHARQRTDTPPKTDARRLSPSAATVDYEVGPVEDVSAGCPRTGDTSEAADDAHGYVYVAFEGCDHGEGIGFVRSTDGGERYSAAVSLPDSRGAWDPCAAVAPQGTLYVAFMKTVAHTTYPVIEVSRDHGQTFAVESSLRPPQSRNWGDAEYLAVAPDGTLYVAWSYGPSLHKMRERCAASGSCWATSGELNVVVQSSGDEGRTFSPIAVVSPGYPTAGADEGAIAVAPDGTVGVLYQDYEVVNRRTLALANGHEFFSSSNDGGRTWSAPVEVGASAGTITVDEWWNDGSLGVDPSGDWYATWDTQTREGARRTDRGWLSFSTDGGREWSAPVQTTPQWANAPHITEVVGGPSGEAYVAWLSHGHGSGYGEYLRTFSVAAASWLSAPALISEEAGNPRAFPGDTFGLATLSPTQLVLSWGSQTPATGRATAVFAAPVTVTQGG